MATVDSLQIEIKASATTAEKAIDSLVASLQGLSKNLNNVDMGKLSKTADALKGSFGNLSVHMTNVGNRTKILSKHLGSSHSAFNRISSSIKKATSSLKGFGNQTKSTTSLLQRMASKVGTIQNEIWLFRRAFSALGKAVKESMDYIETLNYFEKSFEQVASNAVKDWKEAGYESAEAYYNSFKQRASQLTSKMSGFIIDPTGNLQSTGTKSLGLDPTQTLAYQAQFAQMANSMGVASEKALKLSDALTMIGADLASVKNLDFEQVWGDMASGLVGMSRTLDKYGVNIRNANMQAKLAELGIDANVQSLSQADKALLRTIILLDSTKYAWGDLAETLNQPANQLRLLTANFKNLCRMIGNLFLPLVAKVLPYVNALVIALQRLVGFIAKIFGIDMSKITSSVGGGGSDALGDILDEADTLGEELDDDADSAKKLKQNLMGIDELNIVSKDEDSGAGKIGGGGVGGLLDDAFLNALDDYMNAWNDAFNNLENRANELADKIVDFAKKLFKPISDAWQKEGEYVIDSWKNAVRSLGELLKEVGSDFMEVWQQERTEKFFENVFHIIGDIGQAVANVATNFKNAWVENERGKRILENIRDIFLAISEEARVVSGYFVEWTKNLNFAPALEAIKDLTRAIADNANDIFGIVGDFVRHYLDFFKYIIEDFLPKVIKLAKELVSGIDWESLRSRLDRIFTALEKIAEIAGGGVITALTKLKNLIVDFVNGDFFGTLADNFEKFAKSLENSRSLGETIDAIFDFGDGSVEQVMGLFNDLTDKLNGFLDTLNTVDPYTGKKPIEQIGERIGGLLNTAIENWDASGSGEAVGKLAHSILTLISNALSEVNWVELGMKIGDFLANLNWEQILLDVAKIALQVLGGLLEVWAGSMLKAPLSTGLLTAIGLISFTSHATKILGGLASALMSSSSTSLIGNALNKVFGSKAVKDSVANEVAEDIGEEVATTATATATKTATKTASKGAGLGSALLTGGKWAAAAIATAGVTYDVGNRVMQQFDEDLYKQYAGGEGFQKLFKDTWDSAIYSVRKQYEDVAKKDFESLGRDILGGIGNGIMLALEVLLSPLLTVFFFVRDKLCEFFGIASPAKKMYFIGEYILLGIVEGFKQKIEAFGEAVREFFNRFAEWFGGVKEKLDEYIGTPFKTFFTETLPETMNNFKAKIDEWKTGIVQKFTEWKNSIVETFTEWKNNVIQTVTEWAETIGTKFTEWKNNAIQTVTEWKDNIIASVTEWKDNTVAKINEWYEGAKGAFKNWFEESKQKFSDWKNNVIQSVTEWRDNTLATINEWKTNTVIRLSEWYNEAKGAIGNWFDETRQKFSDWKDNVVDIVTQWKDSVVEKFNQWKTDVVTTVSGWADTVKAKVSEWKSAVETKIDEWKNTTKQKFEEWKATTQQTFDNWKEKVSTTVETWKNNVKQKIEEFKTNTSQTIETWKNTTAQKFNEWKTTVVTKVQEFRDKAKEAIENFKTKATESIEKFKTDTKSKIEEFVDKTRRNFEEWKEKVVTAFENLKTSAIEKCKGMLQGCKEWFDAKHWTFDGIRQGLGQAFDNAIEWVKQKWENFKGILRGMGESIRNVFSGSIDNNYNLRYSGYDTYATGGFPEDGWFRASHGELIGKFDNGQSVVANNMQIVEGIEGGVERAVSNVLAPYLQDIADNTRRTADKRTTVSIDGREIVSAYDSRKARNGFAF